MEIEAISLLGLAELRTNRVRGVLRVVPYRGIERQDEQARTRGVPVVVVVNDRTGPEGRDLNGKDLNHTDFYV